MATIGYVRVSSLSQSTERQDLGDLDKVFEETASAKNTSGHPALVSIIDYARAVETVKVYSIDRLARDLRDLQDIITQLNDKGVTVSFLTERLSFSPNAEDALTKLQLQMMGAFAEFERNIIKKRQAEGIAKAKERGVYAARKRTPTNNRETVKTLREQGLSTYKIADKMGISRMSVHRILKEVAA